ncbi:MAG: caspase family protein [Actinoplanes sp.]
MTHRRALIIATENYDETDKFSQLPGTTQDAEDLQRVLGDPRVGEFHVTVLHDAAVRDAGVEVHQFFSHAEPDDLLLLHISGHGMRDENGDLYFVNADTEQDSLWATALAARDVSREIRNSAARRIIVLLDCCYSGAFVRQDGARGPVVPGDLDDDLRGRGQVIITASTAVQHAFETRSGLFTRCVVHGLETGRADLNGDGEIDANELYHYVRVRMHQLARHRRQNPTYSAHNVQGVLRVAHSVLGPSPVYPPRPRKDPEAVEPRGPRGPFPRPVLRVLLAAAGLLAGCATQGDSPGGGGDCPTPAQVRVAAAPAELGAYREVAGDFERWVAGRQYGCRSADLYLYPVAAEVFTAGLRHNWEQDEQGRDYLRDIGPHPDVWLPGAATDLPVGDLAVGHVVDRAELIARTPIVLGVPERAQLEAGERPATISWPKLFSRADRAGGVVRGDPGTSAVARMATAKLYEDGAADPATARAVEQRVERALDQGAYPVGDGSELLCRQSERHAATSVVLTEQELVRFNRDGPPAGSCPRTGPPADGDRLRAFYPGETPAVQRLAVTLKWPDQAQAAGTRAYAQWFLRWLRQDPGRAALLRAGLRPDASDAGEPIGPRHGALTNWPFAQIERKEPTPAISHKVAELYAAARRPGRFLVALDASGSMNTVTADPSRTRFEVSVAAVEQAVTRLGGRDEFGLLTFAAAGGRTTRPVLPIARPGRDPVGAVRRAAAGIEPGGDTPLYEAIRVGAAALRAGSGAGEPRRTLVVVTDGKDTSSQPPPSAAQTAGVRIFILAVGEVTCADAALERLAAGTAGRCFDAGPESLEPVLTGLFRAVWDE